MASPEYLTVPELAELLRLKERKIYDLAASGEVPCSRATGKLLFPASEVRAWLGTRRTGPKIERPPVFLGSHDPLLDWAIRNSGAALATQFASSRDGLERFTQGEGVATGLHLHEPGAEGWNVEAARRAAEGQDAVLVTWARRARGIVTRQEHADRFAAVEDLAGARIAARQDGAGSDLLLRETLVAHGLDPGAVRMTAPCHSEQDAILAVVQGEADAAFGLLAVARPFGLSFRPVLRERFDLLISRRAWFEPPLQQLMSFARGRDCARRADSLGGYDIAEMGRVVWNA